MNSQLWVALPAGLLLAGCGGGSSSKEGQPVAGSSSASSTHNSMTGQVDVS